MGTNKDVRFRAQVHIVVTEKLDSGEEVKRGFVVDASCDYGEFSKELLRQRVENAFVIACDSSVNFKDSGAPKVKAGEEPEGWEWK